MADILRQLLAILVAISAALGGIAVEEPQPEPVFGNATLRSHGWNYDALTQGTKTTSKIHGKWINWLDTTGWKSINPDFATSTDGTKFEIANAPFKFYAPLTAGGVATMVNDNRWDVMTNTEITEQALTMTLQAEEVANTAGKIMRGDLFVPYGERKNVSYILYKNVYPEGDLIYYIDFGKAPRLEKLVRINSTPTKLSYKFILSYDKPVEFAQKVSGSRKPWNEIENFIFDKQKSIEVRVKNSQKRGSGIDTVYIWDSNQSQRNFQAVDTTFTPTGLNTYRVVKTLPSAFFVAATYPVFTDVTTKFNPDPDVETNSVDCWVRRSGVDETWTTIRSGAGTTVDDSALNSDALMTFAEGATTNQWGQLWRIITTYDTSSIGSTNQVDAASSTFRVNSIRDANNFNPSTNVVQYTGTADTSCASGDFNITNWTMTKQSDTETALGSLTLNANTNYFLFNATGRSNISLTGDTKIGYAGKGDVDNTAPTWVDGTKFVDGKFVFADTTGTVDDPRLTVEYSTAPPKKVPLDEELMQLLFNVFRVRTAWAI